MEEEEEEEEEEDEEATRRKRWLATGHAKEMAGTRPTRVATTTKRDPQKFWVNRIT